MDKYRKNYIYSQNGEEGILIEVFKRLGVKKGVCVEFGAHNGKFCSNTRYFLENGWAGTLIEANPALFVELQNNVEGLNVTLHNRFVTEGNVNDMVPDCDLLSIDCDGPDYGIWDSFTGKAKAVVIEINSSYPPGFNMIMREGTSYTPMVELGLRKGYKLLAHTGNLIFVQDKYAGKFPEVTADPVSEADQYFDKSHLA